MRRSMTSFFTGLREGWGLVRPYFASEERWTAFGLLAAVVLLNLFLTGLNVAFTYWQRDLYNALQDKHFTAFITLLFYVQIIPRFPYVILGYAEYLAIFIIVAVYSLYLNQMLQIRWRQWMTRDFTEHWLSDRAYYHISLAQSGNTVIDNPDQRISQDLAEFTTNALGLGLDLMSNIVTLLSFVIVLYTISGSIKLFGVTIPGYMLWLAIIYSIAGTWITHRLGKKLISLTFMQQKVEADFRYGLIRVRDNPEAIALSGGESDEMRGLRERFTRVRENWWAIMRRTKILGFFTNGYSTLSTIFPLAAAAPRYFAGAIPLGGLVQIGTVFGQVQGPLSWIVNSYTNLVSLRATIARLHGFKEAVTAARAASVAGGPQLRESDGGLDLENLTLSLPDGRLILENASINLPPGQPVLLTGVSGTGKSTLFRSLAGIWPFGSGQVARPRGKLLFLPQRPYFPLGSLKRSIVYPAQEQDFSDDTVRAALEAVELEGLASRLNDMDNWSLILSGGEQQRLALARALLIKPDWLFLDEATSALDTPLTARIQAVLAAELPNTTIVSITHRDMAGPADRHLTLADGVLAPVGTTVA